MAQHIDAEIAQAKADLKALRSARKAEEMQRAAEARDADKRKRLERLHSAIDAELERVTPERVQPGELSAGGQAPGQDDAAGKDDAGTQDDSAATKGGQNDPKE